MGEKRSLNAAPDSDRVAALRSLPRDIVQSMSREEIRAFLHEDIWPDSLKEKLKDYIVHED
ncbi:MAG: hypothetical protein JRH06_16795 [Deltaproteobacteria bacterium]|nr:hypothetical protein [Deltaproteobacteria bacterium]MBW2139193.1 hypothetical protein [Deltaproteobacteria bacterium]